MFLLDTNVVIWMTTGDPRLSRRVRRQLDRHEPAALCVSVLTFYELGVLVERRRVRLQVSLADLRRQILGTGVIEHAVTGEIALDAAGLGSLSRDPIDRLIVAAARVLDFTLVTSDGNILDWRGDLDRLDARR